LRHQVAILRRGGRRPRYTAADRALLAAVSRLLPPGRWSCFAVSPQTLRRWHRSFLLGNRRGRGRRPGRPPLAAATRSLILRLAREHPRWGYVRIEGELLKLGINVSATTVATVLRVSGLGPAPRRIGPRWSEFLRAQAQSMLGAGLRFEPAGGLGANVSARSAPTAEGAACGVKAEEVSANGAEQPSSAWPVPGLRRLSVVAAVPSPRDSPAAPLRPSQQWHARDGPRTGRSSSHARTVRQWCQRVGRSRPALELQPQVGFPVTAARLFTPAAALQRREHHAELAVEPSFFTPQGARRCARPRASASQGTGQALAGHVGHAALLPRPQRRRTSPARLASPGPVFGDVARAGVLDSCRALLSGSA
jgi:hypothetical protein